MQVDFSEIEDVESFVSIPEGSYVCRIAEVRPSATRDGSPRWGVRLEVAEGDYAGRTAGWDGWIWSPRGLPRVKRILQCLGYDVSGTLDVDPEDVQGRRIRAQFLPEQREDPDTGRVIARLRVPYMGYEPVPPDDTPF
jgi:hypothetical protein